MGNIVTQGGRHCSLRAWSLIMTAIDSQQVDGHGPCIGVANKLQRLAVVDQVADRLIGFDGFLEARRRIDGSCP